MTFTYSAFATARDRVRFHLGDTDPAAAKFSDEDLDAVIGECGGDWRAATLACIRHLIARLNAPDFKADWLDVKPSTAVAAWRAVLADKTREFGLDASRFGSGVTLLVRADSDQTGWAGRS